MTHFVFPYFSMPAKGFELSYACKSIKKFFPGKFDIFIVGDHPKFKGKGFHHINCPRIRSGKGREIDVINKMQKAINCKHINDDFIWMYDDCMFLKKVNIDIIKQPIAYEYVKDLDEYLKGRKVSKGYYQRKFKATFNQLIENNLPKWDYETHLPRWYNKHKMQNIINRYNLKEQVYLLATLYFNTYHERPYTTVKKSKIKAELYAPHEPLMIEKLTEGKMILNYADRTINRHFEKYIRGILK